MRRRGTLIFWTYLVEAVAAGLLFAIIYAFAGIQTIATFIGETAAAWANMTGVLFAASLTIWIAFTNITATDFGGYLKHKGEFPTYSGAFIASLVVFFIVTVAAIAAISINAIWFRAVVLTLLIYAAINVVTMVRNATGLVRAYTVFKEEVRKAGEAQMGHPKQPIPNDKG